MRYIHAAISSISHSPGIVRLLLVNQFLEGFVPIMALYALMFERVGHLSFSQISTLFAIWSLAYLVIELPSGVLADYWSRRAVIMVGGLLRALGFAIWLVWPSFWGYAIGFALWGAMIACSSGALTAYLHNELRARKQSNRYAKYFGWIMAAHWLGTLGGYVLASVLTLQHANVLIVLSLVSSLAVTATLAPAGETPYKRQNTYLRTMRAGITEILHSRLLQYIGLGMFAIYMILGVIEELLPRFYAQFGLNDTGVSIVLALALLLTVGVLARLEAFVHFSITKQLFALIMGVLLLIIGMHFGGWGGIALLFAFNMVFQLFRAVFQHHVQQAATGEERATIGSVPGLAAGLLGAGAYVVIGKIASLYSEPWSIMLYGMFWLALLLGLSYWGRTIDTTRLNNPAD